MSLHQCYVKHGMPRATCWAQPSFPPLSLSPPHTMVALASPNVIVFESRNFFLFVAVPQALRKAGPFYLEGARSEAEKNHGREVVGGELL